MKQELHNDCDGGQCVACAREAEEGFDELQFVKDQCTTLSANNSRLIGENRELERNQQALMDQYVKFEEQIAQMMTVAGDQAATIRRLTEERLGPEKSLYEQAKGLGIGIAPQGVPMSNPAYQDYSYGTLVRAIEAEGYRVLIDPDGVYSVEKKSEDPATGD